MTLDSCKNSHALETLDMKKVDTLKKNKLIKLTTSLSSEVNNLQYIVQTLEQHLKLMGKK